MSNENPTVGHIHLPNSLIKEGVPLIRLRRSIFFGTIVFGLLTLAGNVCQSLDQQTNTQMAKAFKEFSSCINASLLLLGVASYAYLTRRLTNLATHRGKSLLNVVDNELEEQGYENISDQSSSSNLN